METRAQLLRRIASLQTEIENMRGEIERATASVYEPRIRDLEAQLEDGHRMVLELRGSIAASSRRRWQRWPVGLFAIAIIAFFVVMVFR